MRLCEPKVVIRPIRKKDLPSLYALAKASGAGFTTLPANEAFLSEKIELSLSAFNKGLNELTAESYLMVMEDLKTKKVVGTSGMVSNVGTYEIMYQYKLGKLIKECQRLGVRKAHKTLTLTTDYEGVAEVCSLFLTKPYRKDQNGQLLARCRYLFLAEHQRRFPKLVIAKMRGVSDEKGRSPFWNAVGRHFFGVEFPRADYLTGMGEKQFIVDLMPEFRLYVCMLPQDARRAIGEVHQQTVPAYKLIQREGFHYTGYNDIFDAGPTVEAKINKIRSVRDSVSAVIQGYSEDVDGVEYIMSNAQLDVRATLGGLRQVREGEVRLPKAVAKVLKVKKGDSIRYVPVHGAAN